MHPDDVLRAERGIFGLRPVSWLPGRQTAYGQRQQAANHKKTMNDTFHNPGFKSETFVNAYRLSIYFPTVINYK